MALTAYCKKCGREVEPGEICPRCGTRLGKNAAHAAWCVERTPVKDWMYWNSVMRVLLPAALVILVLVLVLEAVSGGIAAVERMMTSGFPLTLLILRLRSPSLLRQAEGSGASAVLKLGEKDLAWKDVARVQLWPEKCMVLYYAPSWWLRIAVACTPFSWEDVMALTREKLGKKRKIRLPASLVIPPEQKSRRAAPAPRPAFEEPEETPGQMSLFDETPDDPSLN